MGNAVACLVPEVSNGFLIQNVTTRSAVNTNSISLLKIHSATTMASHCISLTQNN